MPKHTITTAFELGDIVFIKLPGSEPYLVTNIIMNFAHKMISYEITAVDGVKMYMRAGDISKEPRYDVE